MVKSQAARGEQREMPTMRSKLLGGELRRLRLEKGLRVQDVADALECGQPKISQIETGRRGVRQFDLSAMLDLYGVTDEQQRASIKQRAKELHKVDWWTSKSSVLNDALKDYLALESDSVQVRNFESQVIPGLLQTESYMRQIFAGPVSRADTETFLETRMARKALLDNQEFSLRVVIDMAVLLRITPDIAEEQYQHLIAVGSLPNVAIQILPLDIKMKAVQHVPFAILTLGGIPTMDVVFLEHLTGGSYLEGQADVAVYDRAWQDLTAAALAPGESERILRNLEQGK